ncbi:MAG: DUF2784 domain-containing protein [Desulfobacterales bacterium]|nr:DUF2784 domain-containing protein [Desulfobacterales bacterium]
MNPAYSKYLLAADVILLIHFLFVAFVVLGFIFIWIGYFTKQKFARNAKFRICHILVMGIVLCESLIGMICPLTEWENYLRVRGGQDQVYETSFMKEWIHKIMFFDFSELTFVIVYALFFAVILLTFWVIPPDFKKPAKRQSANK